MKMENIKFRLWHKDGVMLYDDRLGDALRWRREGQSKEDPMQFTGLHDRNGKEIYEGDLLRYSIQDNTQARLKLVIIPDIFEELGHDDCYYLPQQETFEIIGNIYENPELLEAE